MRGEHSVLKEVPNPNLFSVLSKLVKLISHRMQPFHVLHVRSHTELPGAIAKGNRKVDALDTPVKVPSLSSVFEQAKLSHHFYHQNISALVRMCHLLMAQAEAIVGSSASCQSFQVPFFSAEVNPYGLHSCQLWETDVTHIPSFGRQKYVHVSVHTFSGAVFASAHAGKNVRFTKRHFLLAFSTLVVPQEIMSPPPNLNISMRSSNNGV